MSTILEAEARIKAKDATGGTFDAIASKISRLARAANALNRDVEKQISLSSRAEASAGRLARSSQAIGSGAKMIAAGAGIYGGTKAVEVVAKHLIKSGSDRGHEETRMRTSGMTEAEIEEANKLASATSLKYKSLSQTEIMHTARNVRAVVGTFEEATKIIDPLMQLRVVAQGAHPEHAAELGEDFDKLVKGMEIKGVTQDLDKFDHYIDGMAKALNVFGDTLRPTDYYEMFKYGRAATTALSDDFMLKTAPTLAQELGGSSAGKALSSFHTQFIGGKMSNKAVEMLDMYGMIDKSKVIKTATGNVKGVLPGGIIGGEYLKPGQEDPYGWVNNVLLPQLAKKGVTDPAQIQEVISAMASQTTTAQMMNIFATQQKRIEKDWELSRLAKGKDAAAEYLQHDPKVALKAVEAQADNYFSSVAKPLIGPATKAMNWLADGLNYMSRDPVDLMPHVPIGPLRQYSRTLYKDKFDRLDELDEADKASEIYGDKDFETQAKARNASERSRIEAELAEKGYAGPDVPGRGWMRYSVDDIRAALGIGGASADPAKAEIVGNATLETTVKVEPSPLFNTVIDQRIDNKINAFKNSGSPATGSTGSTGRGMPEATAPM